MFSHSASRVIVSSHGLPSISSATTPELALATTGSKRKKLDFNASIYGDAVEDQDEMKLADTRKVVVEDLIFIDDLEMLIYSTVSPKTSTIFVTSLQKHKTDQK